MLQLIYKIYMQIWDNNIFLKNTYSFINYQTLPKANRQVSQKNQIL